MKLKGILAAALFIVLLGCGSASSFKPDTFSDKDMCIVKVDDEKVKVCYGMSRTDVEKILGKGKEGENLRIYTEYDFGVNLMYRDDIARGLMLQEGSESVYTTARGVKVGQTKEDVKSLHGSKYAIDIAENSMEYYYDNKDNKFLGAVSLEDHTPESLEKTSMLSVGVQGGKITRLWLADRKMLVLLH
ncbi:hypothetical protein EBB07_00660 [Paenibacillaceae bacterium]|nr:hypothetical protein EBB07_00660 [Paenibacillaceae bacterium]